MTVNKAVMSKSVRRMYMCCCCYCTAMLLLVICLQKTVNTHIVVSCFVSERTKTSMLVLQVSLMTLVLFRGFIQERCRRTSGLLTFLYHASVVNAHDRSVKGAIVALFGMGMAMSHQKLESTTRAGTNHTTGSFSSITFECLSSFYGEWPLRSSYVTSSLTYISATFMSRLAAPVILTRCQLLLCLKDIKNIPLIQHSIPTAILSKLVYSFLRMIHIYTNLPM